MDESGSLQVTCVRRVANVAGTQEPIYGSSAIQSVAAQARETPFTTLTKDHLRWEALEYTNVEVQVFYFMTDSGHLGMTQLIYSNVAGIRTTCQFNTKLFSTDGKTPHIWSSDPLENYGFDDEKHCFYADGCAIDLNELGDEYTIKSATNEASIVNMTVKRIAPGFQVGKDGKSYFGTDPQNPWGSMRHAFWPRCECGGTIITKDGEIDLKGKGMFVMALQGMKPHHAAASWKFMDFQGPTHSAVMMEFTTPPSYGSTVVNVGGIVRGDQILWAGASNTAEHTRVKNDEHNDWPEPEAAKFEWHGKTADGKDGSAIVQGDYGTRLDRVDVLAEVPGFVKTLVGGVVGTKPYVYQYYPGDLKLKVVIDGQETVEEGTAYAEATFIS